MAKKAQLAPGAPFPKQNPLQIVCFQDSRYSWAGIAQEQPDGSVRHLAHGSAMLDPEDTFDYETGLLLAMGRALVSLGNQYLKRGNGLVKHHDDVKADQSRRLTTAEALQIYLAKQKDPVATVDAMNALYRSITTTPSGRIKGGHWEGSAGHRIFVEDKT